MLKSLEGGNGALEWNSKDLFRKVRLGRFWLTGIQQWMTRAGLETTASSEERQPYADCYGILLC